jgi:hypothetical protein
VENGAVGIHRALPAVLVAAAAIDPPTAARQAQLEVQAVTDGLR